MDEEERGGQEVREDEERRVLEEQRREVKSQEERKTDNEARGGQERRVDAQGGREGGGEKQEDVNSLLDECHVSNRHMTWRQNAWWIRVDNGPHMRSARGRRRTWRAARQAAEQVRDQNCVEETQKLAEEAEGEKW